MRALLDEQVVGYAGLDDSTFLEHDYLVVVEDRIELVRDCEDGMRAEFLADDTLHDFVGFGVDAGAWHVSIFIDGWVKKGLRV